MKYMLTPRRKVLVMLDQPGQALARLCPDFSPPCSDQFISHSQFLQEQLESEVAAGAAAPR